MDISRIESDSGWRDTKQSDHYRGKHYTRRQLEITGELTPNEIKQLEHFIGMTRPIGQSFRMVEYSFTPTGTYIIYEVYCDSGD